MGRALIAERDDLQLVKDAVGGDTAAFDLLIARHSEGVFRLALRMLGSREEAEDIQQESFVLAYRSLSKFRGDSSFGTWLYAIASRLCLSKHRLWARRPRVECVESEDLWQMPAESTEEPEERLLAREAAERVQRTLALLAPQDRLLLVLKYVESLSHEEIARVVGCSAESSRSRLTRAKKVFRRRYERTE